MGENLGRKLDKANKQGLAVIGLKAFLRLVEASAKADGSQAQARSARRL